jgi:hypothetical protein
MEGDDMAMPEEDAAEEGFSAHTCAGGYTAGWCEVTRRLNGVGLSGSRKEGLA